MIERERASSIFARIQKSKHIGIFTHISPDGDALGSSFGLAGYLKECGKDFTVFISSEIPDSLKFMVPATLEKNIVFYCVTNRGKVKECDLLIGIDFNCLHRTGEWENPFRESKAYKILIDHHQNPETESFDTIESETKISSASELAYNLLKMAPDIDGDVTKLSVTTREALLTGMTTDTNNFANSVYPSTLQMASELLAAGTDRDKIIRELYFSYPERRVKAQGYVLDKLLKITDFGVAYIFLDSRTQTHFGLKEGDTEGFVNIPLSMEKVKMSIFAKREKGRRKIRISIRSKKGTSALECAGKYFHGGGHEQASGGKLIIGEDIASEKEVGAYIEKYSRKFFMEKNSIFAEIMNKAIHISVSAFAAAVMFASCAKEVVETDNEASLRAFTAWVNAHYPDVKDTTGCGIYIIRDKAGDGPQVCDSSYIFQEYEIRALSDSSIVSYSGDSLAKQLGQYSLAAYYGPNIFLYNKATTKAGLKDLLNGGGKTPAMRIGGERTAIIPAAVSPTNADCIYRIKVIDQKKDIVQWQIDEIEKYMKAHNIEIGDTTGHRGFYYWRDKAREQRRKVTVIDTAKFPSDTTVYINYVGRHLNGQAFDTNIADSAKVNGIYNASSSYGPSSVTWNADSTAIKLGGSSVIKGFSLTLWHMHPLESGLGLFISDYGYGSSGNNGIGAYEPLIFEIDIVKKE